MFGESLHELRVNLRLSGATLRRLQELQSKSGQSIDELVSQAVERCLPTDVGRDTSSLEKLTARQREVLRLIAEGHKTKDIARQLGISVKTVEMHRSQMMEALDLHSIVEVVRFAIRTGIVEA